MLFTGRNAKDGVNQRMIEKKMKCFLDFTRNQDIEKLQLAESVTQNRFLPSSTVSPRGGEKNEETREESERERAKREKDF